MVAATVQTFTQSFTSLAELFSPALTGGILNQIFTPINSSEKEHKVLTTREFTHDYLIQFLKHNILHPVQSTEVLDVLPLSAEQKEHGQNRYLVGLVVAVVFTVISLSIWLSLVITACCWRKKQRRQRGKTCYYVFAGTCIGLLVASLLLTICNMLVTASLANSLSVEAQGTPNPNKRIYDAMTLITKALPAFFNESFKVGVAETQTLQTQVETALDSTSNEIFPNIISDLQSTFKLDELVDKNILNTLSLMTNKTASITTMHTEMVNNLKIASRKMNNLHQDITTKFDLFCKNMDHYPCSTKLSDWKTLDFSVNDSTISSQISLLHKLNMSKIAKVLSNIEKTFNNTAKSTLKQITAGINLKDYFKDVNSFWQLLNGSALSNVNEHLERMSAQVRMYGHRGYTAKMMAYNINWVISLVILITGATYVIAYAARSTKDQSSKCTPPLCILTIVFGVLGIFLFIMTIFGALATVPIWLNNEVCRYVVHPRGVEITDASLNLFLEHHWPILLKNQTSKLTRVLHQTPPKNVLRAVTSLCGATGSDSESQGLLELVGLTELLNITKLFQLPEIMQAIKSNRQMFITAVETSSFTGFYEDAQKLKSSIDNKNYTKFLDQFKNPGVLNKIQPKLQNYENIFSNIDKNINQTFTKLRTLINSTYANLSTEIGSLLTEYNAISNLLADFLNISSNLNRMLTDKSLLNSTLTMLHNNWTENLIENMNEKGKTMFNNFTKKLFPCRSLHLVTKTAFNVICGEDGVVKLSGSCFTLMAANSAFLLICMLIVQTFTYYERKFHQQNNFGWHYAENDDIMAHLSNKSK